MILNPKKCYYRCLGKNSNNDRFAFDNLCLENSNEEVILGVTIDDKVTFDSHIKNICRKAGQKLCALSSISNDLEKKPKKTTFQFSYCLLIWMFSSRKSNNLINKIYEGSFRIITVDKESDFQTLLENRNQRTIHQRNLPALMIEVYKIIEGYAPPIMENLLVFRENVHNIRNFQVISKKYIKTARNGLEIIRHRTPFWANLPIDIKLATSLSDFKTKMKRLEMQLLCLS